MLNSNKFDQAQNASGIAILVGHIGSKSTPVVSLLPKLKEQGRSINTLKEPPEFDLGIIDPTASLDVSVKKDNEYAKQ